MLKGMMAILLITILKTVVFNQLFIWYMHIETHIFEKLIKLKE